MKRDSEETKVVNEFIHAYEPVYKAMMRAALDYVEEAENNDEVTDGTMDAATSATLNVADKLKEKFISLSANKEGDLDEFRNKLYRSALARVYWEEIAEGLIDGAKRLRGV